MIASQRSNLRVFSVNIKTISITVDPINTCKSKFIAALKGMGVMVPVIPRMKKILKMLEPTTLPMAMSVAATMAGLRSAWLTKPSS